jgi:DNA-binding response OmpR family regulator
MDVSAAPAHTVNMNNAVLIVDDNLPYLEALQDTLEPLGVEVVTASSGEEALRLVLERDFAIVIMDLLLPGLNGFEVGTLIRRRDKCRDMPIVISTGLEEAGMAGLAGYRPGSFELMTKPVRPERLRAKVVAACVARFQPAP